MAKLDPTEIKKPSRSITNMLAELKVYCSNKENGCEWTGPDSELLLHLTVRTTIAAVFDHMK